MFRRIIGTSGLSQTKLAELLGITKQALQSKMKAQSIAFLFLLVKTVNAKLFLEYEDGSKINLMQFADEFKAVKRPDVKDYLGKRSNGL